MMVHHMVNEPTCCCGKGALIVAIAGLVFNLGGTVFWGNEDHWYYMSAYLLVIFLYAFSIYASLQDKAWPYLPFVIGRGILLVVEIGLSIWLFVGLFAVNAVTKGVTDFGAAHIQKEDQEFYGAWQGAVQGTVLAYSICIAIYVIVRFIFEFWFYIVIYKAYGYVKNHVEPAITNDGTPRVGVATGKSVYPNYNTGNAYPAQGQPTPYQQHPAGYANPSYGQYGMPPQNHYGAQPQHGYGQQHLHPNYQPQQYDMPPVNPNANSNVPDRPILPPTPNPSQGTKDTVVP